MFLFFAGMLAMAVLLLAAWRGRLRQRHGRTAAFKALDADATAARWQLRPHDVFSDHEQLMLERLREALPHHQILWRLPLAELCRPAAHELAPPSSGLPAQACLQFAVVSTRGRLLAAIELIDDDGAAEASSDSLGPSGSLLRLKQAMLKQADIHLLLCHPDRLPACADLQLLIPQPAGMARGPQPSPPADAAAPSDSVTGNARQHGRTPLWQDALPLRAPSSTQRPPWPDPVDLDLEIDANRGGDTVSATGAPASEPSS